MSTYRYGPMSYQLHQSSRDIDTIRRNIANSTWIGTDLVFCLARTVKVLEFTYYGQ